MYNLVVSGFDKNNFYFFLLYFTVRHILTRRSISTLYGFFFICHNNFMTKLKSEMQKNNNWNNMNKRWFFVDEK